MNKLTYIQIHPTLHHTDISMQSLLHNILIYATTKTWVSSVVERERYFFIQNTTFINMILFSGDIRLKKIQRKRFNLQYC